MKNELSKEPINQSIAKYNISAIRHCPHQPGDVLKIESRYFRPLQDPTEVDM
jgi:hypothetical protein